MAQLALNGGPQAAELAIPPRPQVTDQERAAVLEALEARVWCLGPIVREFAQAMTPSRRSSSARKSLTGLSPRECPA